MTEWWEWSSWKHMYMEGYLGGYSAFWDLSTLQAPALRYRDSRAILGERRKQGHHGMATEQLCRRPSTPPGSPHHRPPLPALLLQARGSSSATTASSAPSAKIDRSTTTSTSSTAWLHADAWPMMRFGSLTSEDIPRGLRKDLMG